MEWWKRTHSKWFTLNFFLREVSFGGFSLICRMCIMTFRWIVDFNGYLYFTYNLFFSCVVILFLFLHYFFISIFFLCAKYNFVVSENSENSLKIRNWVEFSDIFCMSEERGALPESNKWNFSELCCVQWEYRLLNFYSECIEFDIFFCCCVKEQRKVVSSSQLVEITFAWLFSTLFSFLVIVIMLLWCFLISIMLNTCVCRLNTLWSSLKLSKLDEVRDFISFSI